MGCLFPSVAAQRDSTEQEGKQNDPEQDSPGSERCEDLREKVAPLHQVPTISATGGDGK
jgi:hypothetical protein